MFIKDFSRYVVLKKEDVDKTAPLDQQYLDRAIQAVRVQRMKAKKPQRNYVVVSDSDPDLFEKVWKLIEEKERETEQSAAS